MFVKNQNVFPLQIFSIFLIYKYLFRGHHGRTPDDKKHEPLKLNYYTFGNELMPLGVNSLSFP
jgi:hypothetical protein